MHNNTASERSAAHASQALMAEAADRMVVHTMPHADMYSTWYCSGTNLRSA